ncbi:MAG TPA: hypothetical protein VHE79_00130, partial [Spirochaetia bacterium]
MADERFDVLFLGAYTKDTVVVGALERTVDGGAFYYGASVAARAGLSTAAVTRLSRQDMGVVEELRSLGIVVAAVETPESTCLRLVYSEADPDRREIFVESTAGGFAADDLGSWRADAAVVGASFRGEV